MIEINGESYEAHKVKLTKKDLKNFTLQIANRDEISKKIIL